MQTVTIKIFKFNELSAEAQKVAINNLLDINVDYQWWESTYDDAKNVGLKITSFDLDRNRHATGVFIDSAEDCANKIISEHGETCETYKTAQNYLSERAKLVESLSDGCDIDEVSEGNEDEFDELCDELDEQFLKDIVEDYSIILQKECEYLQSEEAIIESIEANDYDFTADGKMY